MYTPTKTNMLKNHNYYSKANKEKNIPMATLIAASMDISSEEESDDWIESNSTTSAVASHSRMAHCIHCNGLYTQGPGLIVHQMYCSSRSLKSDSKMSKPAKPANSSIALDWSDSSDSESSDDEVSSTQRKPISGKTQKSQFVTKKAYKVCQFCNKLCETATGLASHQRVCPKNGKTTQKKPCRYCHQMFMEGPGLSSHQMACQKTYKNKHSLVKKACQYCHQMFRVGGSLITHQVSCKKKHVKADLVPQKKACQYCHQMFEKGAGFASHQRGCQKNRKTQTKKPYQYCHQMFEKGAGLSNHQYACQTKHNKNKPITNINVNLRRQSLINKHVHKIFDDDEKDNEKDNEKDDEKDNENTSKSNLDQNRYSKNNDYDDHDDHDDNEDHDDNDDESSSSYEDVIQPYSSRPQNPSSLISSRNILSNKRKRNVSLSLDKEQDSYESKRQRQHINDSLICQYCDKQYSYRAYFIRHQKFCNENAVTSTPVVQPIQVVRSSDEVNFNANFKQILDELKTAHRIFSENSIANLEQFFESSSAIFRQS